MGVQDIIIFHIGHKPCNWHVTEKQEMKQKQRKFIEYQRKWSCNWHVTGGFYIGHHRCSEPSLQIINRIRMNNYGK